MNHFSFGCLHAHLLRICLHGPAGICTGKLYVFWEESKNCEKEAERIAQTKRTRKSRTKKTDNQFKFNQSE